MLMDFVRNAGCDASSPFDLQPKVQERLTCISEQHRRLRFYEEIVFHTGEPLPFAALEHKDTLRLGHLEDRHAEDRRGGVRASSGVDDIIGAYDDCDVRFRETTVDLVHVDKLVIRDSSLGEQYVHVTRHAACDRMYGIADVSSPLLDEVAKLPGLWYGGRLPPVSRGGPQPPGFGAEPVKRQSHTRGP